MSEQKRTADIYLGIMTGTSLDAIDVAACRFDGKHVELLAFHSVEWPTAIREILMELATAEMVSMDLLARTHFLLAREYAKAVEQTLEQSTIAKSDVRAIALHGQTIRHLPIAESVRGLDPIAATYQLGSGSALAALMGIDVVSDFRSGDVALGGQGAPLVPMFDYAFLASESEDRLVVNIGGIANVTWLPRDAKPEDVIAFDSGPGNMLLDSISSRYFGESYDKDGNRARNGTINDAILQQLLGHPYFAMKPPKSTGRELFGEEFLRTITQAIDNAKMSVNDALATLTELTARSIADTLTFVTTKNVEVEIIVSGGGAMNLFLMERIQFHAPNAHVVSSDLYNIPAKAKEAIAFAFFGKAFLEEIPIHLPQTTGASRKIILGSHSLGMR